MADTIVIERRYCGPPDSGNGGYVSGRLAAFLEGPVQVRLQVPPPLCIGMEVRKADEAVELVHGGTVIARAQPTEVGLTAPQAPAFAAAEAAARSYRGFLDHPFPGCFVCGPARAEGDGLRIFPGTLPGGLVGCPWVPDASLGDRDGRVRAEFLWSALDCPGAFSFAPAGPVLLGQFAVSLSGPVAVGERCTVVGWEISRDGRRHYTGTALYAESGACRGIARATWFEMPK